jgi:tetratricopeptide (TPR) repeat protein
VVGLEAYRRAVPESVRIHGAGDQFTLELMSNLASALVAVGDLTAARDVRQRAFEISQDEPGFGPASVVYALTGLSSVQLAQGDLDGAQGGYRQALTLRREDLNEWRPEVGAARNGLARALLALRDYTAAEDLYIEAVEQNESGCSAARIGMIKTPPNGSQDRSGRLDRRTAGPILRITGDRCRRLVP